MKNSEISKIKENNMYINKYKLYRNDIINEFRENKNISNNLKFKRKEKKYKNKFIRLNIIPLYNIILNILLYSQIVKCNYRKNELASFQINLKINGTGNLNIYSESYGRRPREIIINNKINLSDSQNINYFYNFEETGNNINNVTLLWNAYPTSTNEMFIIIFIKFYIFYISIFLLKLPSALNFFIYIMTIYYIHFCLTL